MILSVKNEIVGLIAVADTVKDSSVAAINRLKDLEIEVVMLTGDNEKTATTIGQKVGIKNIIANVLPGLKRGSGFKGLFPLQIPFNNLLRDL